MTPVNQLTAEAAREDRRERADVLFREYAVALVVAQTSHEAFDWIAAGSIFKRYTEAAVAAECSSP